MPYFITKDNKYEPLVPRNSRAYYQMKGNVTPFPPGFRMVSGDAMSRDETSARVAGMEFAFACETGSSAPFHLPNGSTHQLCNTLKMQVTFPSCGRADQTLDSDNHFDHVAFPIRSDGGKVAMKGFGGDRCPASHPIKYPIIHLELYFSVTDAQAGAWRTNGTPNFILANGDTVGTSLHADFVNGWDDEAQRKMIFDCAAQGGNNAEQCTGLADFDKVNDAENCRFAGMIPDEDIGFGKALDKLPGCNERWDSGTPSKPGCEVRPEPGWVAPNAVLKVNGYASEAIPVALDVGGQNITDVKPSLAPYCKFEDWNSQMWWFREKGTNQGAWLNSTAADISLNLLESNSGANMHPSVFGMQDTSAYTSRTPSTPVPGEEATYTTNIVPQPTCTWNGLSSAC